MLLTVAERHGSKYVQKIANHGTQMSTQKSKIYFKKKTQKSFKNFYVTLYFTCFIEKIFYSFSCVPNKSAHAPPLYITVYYSI